MLAAVSIAASSALAACGGGAPGSSAIPHAAVPAAAAAPRDAKRSHKRARATNAVSDPGFESDGFTYWKQCGSVSAAMSTSSHSGSYAARMGGTAKPEINGDAAICQSASVPAGGQLSFWVKSATDETSGTYAWQTAQILNSSGTVLTTLYKTTSSTGGWVQRTYDLSAYGGQTVTIKFDVHGNGYSADYIDQYIDDVVLASPAATPSPSPSPSASPTATPKPSASPSSSPKPTPTPAPTGTPAGGSPIQHVIIVLQENRTFDNLFHGYPGANYATTGKTSTGASVTLKPVSLMTAWDPAHQYKNWVTEYNGGGMNGFDKETLDYGSGAPSNYAYSYVQQSDVQPYWNLAQEGVLGDNMFADHRSQSFAGHMFPIAGASGPIDAADPNYYASENPAYTGSCASPSTGKAINLTTGAEDKSYTSCMDFQTIADLLDKKGVSWKYYVDSADHTNYVSAFAVISHIYNSADFTNKVVSPETTIMSDIQNGTLPAVSYVIGTFANSDHAGQSVAASNGPTWVTSVFNAVGQSQYWKNSAIILTYDDWGGWYDHVAPPTQFNMFSPGFRVPLVVVSPYAKRGYVSHNVHYIGSILHYIENNWGLGSLGTSDARSDALDDVFNYSQTPLTYTAVTANGSWRRLVDADLPWYGSTPQDPDERD